MTRSRSAPLAATLLLVAALGVTRAGWASHAQHPPPGEFTCPAKVRFSPHGGAERAVVDTLRLAQKQVHAALYGLTNPTIEAALADLSRAGVRVALKTDRSQSSQKDQAALLARLRAVGVGVEVSQSGRLLHHKFAVIDDRWVITGSFNWTRGAEQKNRDNVFIFNCPSLAARFEAEWETISRSGP